MGHLLPPQPRRRTERRPEEEREEEREEQEARRPAAEQASTPLGGVGERAGESTPINGAEGGRRGWPAWWGWPAAAAASSALYAAYHLSVLLLFLPLPYAILGAPPYRATPLAVLGASPRVPLDCCCHAVLEAATLCRPVCRRALRLRLRLLPPAPHAQARSGHLHPHPCGRRRRSRLRAGRLHMELPAAAEVMRRARANRFYLWAASGSVYK